MLRISFGQNLWWHRLFVKSGEERHVNTGLLAVAFALKHAWVSKEPDLAVMPIPLKDRADFDIEISGFGKDRVTSSLPKAAADGGFEAQADEHFGFQKLDSASALPGENLHS